MENVVFRALGICSDWSHTAREKCLKLISKMGKKTFARSGMCVGAESIFFFSLLATLFRPEVLFVFQSTQTSIPSPPKATIALPLQSKAHSPFPKLVSHS